MEQEAKPGVIFLECAIEIVPPEIRGHPEVIKSAKRYSTSVDLLLLDKNLHYNAMRRLDKKWKRGRPDILHACLLVVDDTPLRSRGVLDVYFQSFDGRIFKISSHTRLPKTYDRFKGVIASVLARERVEDNDGNPLIFKVADSLSEFLSKTGRELLLLWEKGEHIGLDELAEIVIKENILVGIGCFPQGDFEPETLKLARRRASILCGSELKAWGVAYRLISTLERIMFKDCQT